MNNRTPTKVLPNGAIRYGVYDEAQNFLRYEYIKPEDMPTQEGTPFCKETMLKDITSELLGIPLLSNPDDALAAAYLKAVGKCQIFITVLLTSGKPAANTTVSGIPGVSNAVTDSNGKLEALVTVPSITVGASGLLDIEWTPVTISTPIGQRVFITLAGTRKSVTEYTITTSTNNLLFSKDVDTVDVFCVGGGGGGASGNGGGGGGGYTTTVLNIPRKDTPQTAYIGSGGNGGARGTTSAQGNSGGSTSFYGVSAAGGNGAPANGQGGAGGSGGGAGGSYGGGIGNQDGGRGGGSSGGAGQGRNTRTFGETTGSLYAGGGGGGASTAIEGVTGGGPGGSGGSGGGGSGNNTGAGSNGYYGGGGGGGGFLYGTAATNYESTYYAGGKGGDGLVVVRWRYKA